MDERIQMRAALTQVKVDHLNKKIHLPIKTHALVENALSRVLIRPKPLKVRFKRHPTPESVLRAFVRPMKGRLADLVFSGGYMRDGSEAPEVSAEEMLGAIREQGLWGFAATKSKPPVIHYWREDDTSPELLAVFLGHELGHCAGFALDDVEEEWRADTYGEVAKLVWQEMLRR